MTQYGYGNVDEILKFLNAILTNETRQINAKQIKYKGPLNNSNIIWPLNNKQQEVINAAKTKIVSFAVPEIYELLSKSEFFNKIWLPEISKMKIYQADNKPHPEFAREQIEKKTGQYYTNEQQIAMKKETFYDKSHAELWAWWEHKNKKLTSILSEDDGPNKKKSIFNFPLNYKDTANPNDMSILDIIKTAFINILSKIINSYIKYGKKMPETTYIYENKVLTFFVNALDSLFITNKETVTYDDLYRLISYYHSWDKCRLDFKDCKPDDDYMRSYYFAKNDFPKNILILPMSGGLNYYKTVKFFNIPVIILSIVGAMGHFGHFSAQDNMIHDYTHMIYYTMFSGFNIESFYKEKNFFEEYEKLQETIADNKLKTVLNYLVFGLIHEASGSLYYNTCNLNTLIDENYTISSNTSNVSIYFRYVVSMTYLIAKNIDNISDLFESIKKIKIKPSNYTEEINVFKEYDGKLYILGNDQHIEYVDVELFKKSFIILDNLMDTTNIYKLIDINKQDEKKTKRTPIKNTQSLRNMMDDLMNEMESMEAETNDYIDKVTLSANTITKIKFINY